jgi:hypothetical protein
MNTESAYSCWDDADNAIKMRGSKASFLIGTKVRNDYVR